MTSTAIVDAGPLIAWVSRNDRHHESVLRVLRRPDLTFVVAGLALAEALHVVGRVRGPETESRLAAALAEFPVECPSRDDLVRISELVLQYGDFPLGSADASVVALAERLGTDTVLTIDRRHFGAIRPRHCPAFRLLPDPPPG
jgi:predicted nucleic acid-binding protein